MSGEQPASGRAKMHAAVGFLRQVLHAQSRFPDLGFDFVRL
jgi:hypothetical protein